MSDVQLIQQEILNAHIHYKFSEDEMKALISLQEIIKKKPLDELAKIIQILHKECIIGYNSRRGMLTYFKLDTKRLAKELNTLIAKFE